MHPVCFLALSFIVLTAGQVGVQPVRTTDEKTAQSAAAESPRRPAFEFLDNDHNDVLIRDEFLGGTLGKAAKVKLERFKKLDADESGALDFQEFQKLEPLRATPERLAKEFNRLDKDADGKLTLEELLAGRSRQNQPQARRNFIRFDADRDGALTVEEFQRRGKGVKLTSAEQFKIRDEDGDGKLTEDEFLRPARGKSWEAGARRNFFKFDLDHDGTLTLSEFSILPPQKPNAAALFKGLDTDQDKKLTRDELVRVANPDELGQSEKLFAENDRNRDGALDASEHRAYREELAWIAWKDRFWTACRQWGTWILVVLGLVLVASIAQWVRVLRRRKRVVRVGAVTREIRGQAIGRGTDHPDRNSPDRMARPRRTPPRQRSPIRTLRLQNRDPWTNLTSSSETTVLSKLLIWRKMR